MRSLYAEVISQFVVDEGSKQIINIDTPCLVFSENIAKIQNLIQFIDEENGAERRGYITLGSSSLVLNFIFILVNSTTNKDTHISC